MLRPPPVSAPFEKLTEHGPGEAESGLNQAIKSMPLSSAPKLPREHVLSDELDKFRDS